MKDEQLVHLQIELEYQLSSQGRLVPFPGSSEQSRFIVYEVSNGYCRFLREDLPDAICARLEAIPGEEAIRGSDEARAVLSAHAACGPVWIGKSYFFSAPPETEAFQEVTRESDKFVIIESGKVVSWAFSARENDFSAELAVETLPRCRHKGFAKATASAWADTVISSGKVAFFSHTHDNGASEALARSLGVMYFATAAAYD